MSDKTARNDVTGDFIRSKPASDMFEENFDRIFRKKKEESRIDVVGQNGNDGLHYELDDGQLTDEQYAKIKELAEYELNKSTGEVQKKED
jgi:hypothetical protein